MPPKQIFYLRYATAVLITASGTAQVASLWLRQLTGTALIDALLGAVYIIIGIGLFGRSRFTLFMAIAVPATTAIWLLQSMPQPGLAYSIHIGVDTLIISVSLAILWQVRHHPSV